jgi:hypothetical protein
VGFQFYRLVPTGHLIGIGLAASIALMVRRRVLAMLTAAGMVAAGSTLGWDARVPHRRQRHTLEQPKPSPPTWHLRPRRAAPCLLSLPGSESGAPRLGPAGGLDQILVSGGLAIAAAGPA